MATPQRPRTPQSEPRECRVRAEEHLGSGERDVDVPSAMAWALLAIAGELHEIRRQLGKR
ncbi:hypothetical protein DF268_36010 [Streptomyces sp. V2]|uniref:hypothetical protein n=1 Tax=Streptomyces sp. V2 TaxID=1424099 RepID=UPI000D66E77F|nr:hypothetical protein [Streptomyces sp. V2]PWG08777.1 hypothetical protein DF268_36010 [Streptomyces sp. V2]